MSQADAGSGVQPLRLIFTGGLSNRLSKFLTKHNALLVAENVEYRVGDGAVWVAKGSDAAITNPNAPSGDTARAVEVIALESNIDVVLATSQTTSGVTTTGHLFSVPNTFGVFDYIGEINIEDTSGADDAFSPPPEFIRLDNHVYIVASAEIGKMQAVDLSDPENPEIIQWGPDEWDDFDPDDPDKGQTGTRLKWVCEWLYGHPFFEIGITPWSAYKTDYIWQPKPRAPGVDTSHWEYYKEQAWMTLGPNYIDAANNGYQPPWGHLESQIADPDRGDYYFWLTEYNEDTDKETSYSIDIVPIQYTPDIYFAQNDSYYGGGYNQLDWQNDATNTPHSLKQGPENSLVNGEPFGHDKAPSTPSGADTFGQGGANMMVTIDKSLLRDDTTHIRIYMSRRTGVWPEAAQVLNRDLYVASIRDDPTTPSTYNDPTLVGTRVVCGKADASSIFIGLPLEEPGIPIDDIPMTHDTNSGRWITTADSLGVFNANIGYFYILKETSRFPDLGVNLFPTVEAVVDGDEQGTVSQDAPPPKASFGTAYQGSLVTNDLDNPGLVRWSVSGKPDSFPVIFFYDLNDPLVSLRNMGRYMMILGRNKLVLCRYLPYEDVSAESVNGAFITITDSRGAMSHRTTAMFTHPKLGPSVAFFGGDSELWITNGNIPQRLTPQFDYTKHASIWDYTRVKLIDNPAKQRLELHYEPWDNPSFPGGAREYLTISYAPEHMLGDIALNVMGPIAHFNDHVAAVASGPTQVIAVSIEGTGYRVGVSSESAGATSVLSSVINPIGLGKDWMVYAMRTAYRAITGVLSQRVYSYDHGERTFDSGALNLNTPSAEGIIHENLQQKSEGMQFEFTGHTDGAIDVVEIDVDEGVGPLSD